MTNDDEQILICAIRYRLENPRVYPSEATRWLYERWNRLTPRTQAIIMDDIRKFQDEDRLGTAEDRGYWLRLMNWIETGGVNRQRDYA